MEKGELVRKTKDFLQLDRECIELSYETAKPGTNEELTEFLTELIKLCDQGFSIWNEIKMYLGEAPNLRLPDKDIREALKKIRDEKDFFIIRQYKSLAELLNKNFDEMHEIYPISTEDYVRDNFDELFSEFHSWFDVPDYYFRKAQIGCVLVGHHSDRAIDQYYVEIREAYAFGLYKACIGLCRALIELVLHETLRRRKLLGSPRAVAIDTGREERFYLGYLINQAARHRILVQSEKRQALAVKKQAEQVLHLKDRTKGGEMPLSGADAYTLIRDTISVVESVLRD